MSIIIGIVFFAALAGNDEWTGIADFAVDERQTLEKYLELANGIPSHDTIQRVFFILRPEGVQDMLVNILAQMVTAAGKRLEEYLYKNEELDCYIQDVIAADGKETHNTGKKKSEDAAERRSLQEFNVMSTEWGAAFPPPRLMRRAMGSPKCRR